MRNFIVELDPKANVTVKDGKLIFDPDRPGQIFHLHRLSMLCYKISGKRMRFASEVELSQMLTFCHEHRNKPEVAEQLAALAEVMPHALKDPRHQKVKKKGKEKIPTLVETAQANLEKKDGESRKKTKASSAA